MTNGDGAAAAVLDPEPVSPVDTGRARLRRRWPVVVVATVLVMAIAYLVQSVQTQYMSRSALELISVGNTPDQENVLAQGYADFFDQPSTQDLLRRRTGVAGSVVLDARVAAASPILYVEATASDPRETADAVAKVTLAFRDEVERSLNRSTTSTIRAGKAPSPTVLSVLRLDGGTAALPSGGLLALQPYLFGTLALATLAAILTPDRRRRR